MLNTLSKSTLLEWCRILEVKNLKCLVPQLQTMSQRPSHFTDVEGRLSFTPFKYILELLLKMRKIQYSPFQFHTFSTKSKLEKNAKPFSINMSNLKQISEI